MDSQPDNGVDDLAIGLYDHLLTFAMDESLRAQVDPRLRSIADIDPENSHELLAQYLEHLVAAAFAQFRGSNALLHQRRLLERLVAVLAEEVGIDWADKHRLADPLRRLLAVYSEVPRAESERPDTPLARAALLTGTRLDPSLASQLRKEVVTADRVDILCSFIKWSGLRLLLHELTELTRKPRQEGLRLRVITTSYMGATDPRAVESLLTLPNTEVRVSYDTQRTRLHAKAYIIHRETGFGSAYVGSANLSQAAMSEGLEWTTKISQYELPYLWSKIAGTFETYWGDDEFEPLTRDRPHRLREAIRRERATDNQVLATFDLHPYPFQEEILDVLAAEREIQGKHRHLVVAATGTGKTMVAAFDYHRWSRSPGELPQLLFVAHREEILRQALGTFRAVLRDQNFGDLLVGNSEPEQMSHLFCSIQSYNSRELWRLPVDKYRYVVIDEFHHAAAPSYQRLIDHVQPDILLGLTATPERSDQLDVFRWFGGEASAEIRLPDAIHRRLLCPFQYFGVADCVDLDGLVWQRGGYRTDDLDGVYTGNDARAALVLEKTREIVLDPRETRGLGFCVSVAHAEFMSRYFNQHGVPSAALSASSSDGERRSVQGRLRRREINFIFVVDLYNEGIDIPEVDTALFLRPTESLTVYLQQLGRGLRLHDDKECLTVIDFIGAQRREFRFAPRLRALSTNPTGKLDKEIEAGFPRLPPGCFIRLERVAQQRVLRNVRETLRLLRPRMVADVRELGRHLGREPTIREGLDYLDTSLDEVLKRGLWSRLLADAGLIQQVVAPDENRLARGLRRLSHMDDPNLLRFLIGHLRTSGDLDTISESDVRRLVMLHVSLWGSASLGWSLADAEVKLRANPTVVADLENILNFLLAHTHTRPAASLSTVAGPLAIHAEYTRDEILVGLGHWTLENRPDFREGVLHLPDTRVDAFFVTLQKTEEEYSATTMYEDYAVSQELFHWQSQSTTSAKSRTGRRYVEHRSRGYTPLLFVRELKRLPSGQAAPYAFLGPAEYVSHEGSRPMSIIWKLRYPIPARMLRPLARQRVG
jgi:superfamily II DNA or RNA helicase/HKD family nuclease